MTLIILIALVGIGGLIFLRSEGVILYKEVPAQEQKSQLLHSGGKTPIGFEEFTDSNGTWWHTWNTQDDYYFNASSGIQFTNHYNEFWSKNIFCGFVDWNSTSIAKDYCLDALAYTWVEETDNRTYVNITGYKDATASISSKSYSGRFTIRYHLGLNDKNMTIELNMDNKGTEKIPYGWAFKWKVQDIKIGNDKENDDIIIDNSYYDLSKDLDLKFTDADYYFLYDVHSNENIYLDWEKDLDSLVEVKSEKGQYNSPVTLSLNFNELAKDEDKTITMHWIDALCSWSCVMSAPSANINCTQGATYTQTGRWDYTSGSCPMSRILSGRYNVSSTSANTVLGATGGLWTTDPNAQELEFGTSFSLIVTCNATGLYSVDVICDTTGTADKTVNVQAQTPQTCDVVSTSKTFTANENCQNITANNVILNCSGYKIIDTQATYFTPYGIIATGLNNITIKNCPNITHYQSGIDLTGTNNSLITNTTIFDINNGSIGSGLRYGIKLSNSNANNLTNLTLKNIWGTCPTSYGIYILSSVNNTINNSNFINMSETICGENVYVASAIYLLDSNNTIINNSNIYNSTYSGIDISGEELGKSNSNIINNVYIEGIGYVGINDAYGDANITNVLIDDKATGQMNVGMWLFDDNQNRSLIKNVTIQNLSASSSKGISISAGAMASATNWILSDIYLKSNAYNLNFESANGIYISNSTFTNPSKADVYTSYGTNNNIFLLNVSFNHTNITFGNNADKVYVKWYSQINVTNTTSNPQTATVNVSDTNGNADFYGSTTNGLTSQFQVFQSHINKTSPYEWNYTTSIIANETGYTTNTTSLVINQNYIPYLIVLSSGVTNCWSYNAGNKLLTIPAGCLYSGNISI